VPAVQLRSCPLNREKVGAPPQPHVLAQTLSPLRPRTRRRHGASYFFAIVTEIRLRPFERRRRRTSRPPRVFLRARNPWVRLRLLLWGWYVRFTVQLHPAGRGIDTQGRE